MGRVLAVTVALALSLAACGGTSDDDDQSTDTTPPGTEEASERADVSPAVAATIRATAGAAIDQFGDLPTAGAAILVAYDEGYSFDQIVAGIADHALSADGEIEGTDPELALGRSGVVVEPVGLATAIQLDPDKVVAVLAEEQDKMRARTRDDDSEPHYLSLILWAIRDGFPPELIVEAIVLGQFTDATVAAIVERNREIRQEEVRPDLEYCRMKVTMKVDTGSTLTYEQCVLNQTGSTIDELFGTSDDTNGTDADQLDADAETTPPGTMGLLDQSLVPGEDGSMSRESITLTVQGDSATLELDLAFQTAVEYEDKSPVCFEDFTYTSSGSTLAVEGSQVSGSVELILDFDGGTACPGTEQDDIGVPLPVTLTGEIDGQTFTGSFSFDGFVLPFAADVR